MQPQLIGNEIWMGGLRVGLVFDISGMQALDFRWWLESQTDIQLVKDTAIAGACDVCDKTTEYKEIEEELCGNCMHKPNNVVNFKKG